MLLKHLVNHYGNKINNILGLERIMQSLRYITFCQGLVCKVRDIGCYQTENNPFVKSKVKLYAKY